MARLTSVSSWLMNFGKSIGYSAKDVLSEVTPNTSKIVEDAGEEIYKFREFMSDYKSKGKQTERYLDLTDLQKQATGIIEDTINDIKTGNFATPKDDFGDIFGGDDLDFDTDDYTSSEDQDENGVQVRKLNISTDAKATAKATVKGDMMIAETLEKSSKAQMKAQVNTSKAIMNVVNNIGMIAVNRLGASISETNKRLDQLNSNVVSILKFMNENQSKVNQAQLEYLKSAQAYMKVQLEMYDPKARKKKATSAESFINGDSFDIPSYISVVKDNLEKNSSLGQLQAMLGMGSMMGSMMGSFGGAGKMIRPTQMLMNAAMKKLIPKKVQQAIGRVDDLLPKALMGGLSTLSDMKDEPGLKGMLGSILGVGSKKQKTFKLGNYYKGAVPWDGKSKRALEVVIPHYLALIESNTQNIPKITGRHGSKGPEFYDYETGTFKTQNTIREGLKTRTTDAFRGASSDTIGFFESKFADDEKMQQTAKEIMWKHLQPMIFGEKTLENEDNLTKAARAYSKELEGLGLNPYEIAQLVIYFKSTATRLRQYMASLQLSEAEQELFNRRDTDDFGNIKRGFDPRDLGNIYTSTDLSRKEKKDKEKAEESKKEIDAMLERAKGTVFASSKQKNKFIQNLKYNAREGVGTTHGRINTATNVEAAGLGLINILSGYESVDTSSGINGVINSAKSIYAKNKYDHMTVDDVMTIMRKNGYNPDQYDFITADRSGDKDGIFGLAVLKFRYGRKDCLRVVKRRNIVWNESSKKYTIEAIDVDDIVVTSRDQDKDLQPPKGSDIYSMDNTSLPRTGKDQYNLDLQVLATEHPIDEKPKDTRGFKAKAKDAVTKIMTGVDPYEEELKRQKEEKERKNKKSENNTATPSDESLGHGPGKRRNEKYFRALERSNAQVHQNTNAASERRAQEKNAVYVQAEAINESVYQLNAASDVIKDSFTKGDKSANTLWNKIKSKIGLNKKSAKRGAIGGIVGSLFLPGGPIGGAIIGATIGIATSGIDFKKIIFGSKTVDDDGTVHYEKTGVLGQWQNMLQNEGKSVVQDSFDLIKREVSAYAKAQFAPVIAAFQSPDGKSIVSKTMVQTIQKVGTNVVDIIAHPMNALNNMVVKISGAMLRSTIKTGTTMLKLVSKGAIWAASKPAQLASDIWSSRNSENPLRFILNVRGARRQRNRARRGAKIDYYTSGNFFGGLKDSIATFKDTKSLTKARAKMADTRVSFFDNKYSKEKSKLDSIRTALNSVDPAERQRAIEEMLPKDKDGNIKDKKWNALKGEDGSIDPEALNAYISKNSRKLLNSKEQALAGLSAGAKYEKEKLTSKNKAKFSKAISKFNRKDAYQYKDLSDEEFEKRRALLDKYAERDENGNFVDKTYERARKNKEDLDKYTKNQAELEKEFAQRDAKKKEEEEKAKLVIEEKNYRMSQMAINIAQLEATLGRKISFDYEYGSDSYSAILSAVDSAMTDAADEKEDKEQDQASIAEEESRKKKASEAELAGEQRRSTQKAENAAELEKVQASGRDKVQDETAQNAEDDRATIVEGGGTKSEDGEEEESSPLSDFLKKAGMAAGGVAIAAALLNSPAGKAVINVLGNVIGGALKTIGGTIVDWVKDGLGDLATNIVDGVRNLLPGGSDNIKEMDAEDVADINPDYVNAGTTVDENGNEVVTTTVNNDKAFALTNFGKRMVTNSIQTGGKSTQAYAKVAGFAVDHADDVYKAGLKVGKVALKGADMVTNLIPGVSTAKKIVGGAGKATATVAKGAAGLLSKVTNKASNLTTAGWAATNGNKALEMLTNILDTLTAALEKFSKCKQLSSLIKDFSPTTLIKTIKDKATAVVNAAKAGIKDTRIGKIVSDGYTKITTGTLGQAVKTATLVVSGVWSAATGALDAANLFMVDEDSVDITMRTVSAIISLLIDFVPVVGPIFDLFSTLSEALGFSNFKRDLAEGIYEVLYNLFGLKDKGVQTVDQRQEEYEKEYQAYLTEHGLTEKDLSIVEYNDIANQTVGSKIFNKATSWLSGIFKKSDNAVTQTGVASSYAAASNTAANTASSNTTSNKSTPASSYLGGGTGSSKSGSALGYGMAQDDPSYAGIDLGTLPDGSRANMANSGCGPTALANAVNAIGGDANPGEVGVYAKKRGMLTQGGANSKLFTEGAKKYGLQGTEISGMDSLDSSLANGNPVIVSGKSMGYGCADGSCSLYTQAGHIVTVKGKTSDGNYRVDDGEGESIVSPEMLQNGATHAFSMKRLGGAATMGTTASQGVDVSAAKQASSQTAANANVMQDNGSTIQHGAYYFAQNDPTWSGQTLSGYSSAIKNSGCVMTSAAMGTSTILGKPIDPGTFNQYGNGNVHSTKFGNLGVKVTRIPANGSQGNVQNSSQYLDQIVSALKQRKMVMMYGGKSASNMYNDGNPNGNAHCVLATGLDSSGNIIVNNPWAASPPYSQVKSASVAYPPVPSSVDPFYWAQIIETPDGKGASTTLDASGISGVAAGGAAGTSGASGTTTGADGTTTGTAADGTTADSSSSGNLFDAIFNAMGNIVTKVGNRLTNSVMSGKSYDEVKAEEEASTAATGATDTTAATGYGTGVSEEQQKANTLRERGKITDKALKAKLSKAELSKVNFGPDEDIGHGTGTEFGYISGASDYMDQIVSLLTDIRDNTGNMKTGGALGNGTKTETGKNTNASKAGNKTDTQKKQRARDSAKSKLSSLNNGLNTDSLSRSNLRSTYAKLASF